MTEITDHDAHDENSLRPSPDWEDPNIPVGNAPPMPAWPLAVSLIAWTGGVVFLLVMMAERLSQ
jgi:hypothetical protein